MSTKLVTVDTNGTLLTDDRKIAPEVFEAVQDAEEQGVKVIIATGRLIPGVQALLGKLNLREPGDCVVTSSGGLAQDTVIGENVITETATYGGYLDVEFLSRKLDVHVHAITKEDIFTTSRNIGKHTVHKSTLVNMPIFYRTPEETSDKKIIKVMFIDEPEILDTAITKIPQGFYGKYTIVKLTPFYLEFMNKGASKDNAITHLAEKAGLSKDQTIAIGDVGDDRVMLEAVSNPVVMEDGIPELKEIAKHITKSNEKGDATYALRERALK